jgi:16S rRNA G966 N2-methylase RsmD
MIGQDLSGTTTVDLFGGSGLMAFEFWSRGSQVQVVEKNSRVAAAIRENARKLSAELHVQVGDARRFRPNPSQPLDYLFMDPPYADRPLDWLEVAGKLGAALTILEHRTGAELPVELHGMVLSKQKSYGDSSLALFQRRPLASSPES